MVIEQLRGLAILLVVAYHGLSSSFGRLGLDWAGTFQNFDVSKQFLLMFPATFGWMGVAIFFAISGFCIHLSHAAARDKTWKTYFIKRTFRIYPPYLAIMLFFALIFTATKVSLSELGGQSQIVTHALFIHNFFPRSFYGITGAFWSIAIEFQLYLIYPVILSFTKRIGWTITGIIVALVELSLRLFASIHDPIYGLGMISLDWTAFMIGATPFFYIFSWWIGAAVANAFLIERKSMLLSMNPLPFFFIAMGMTFFRPLLLFAFPLIAIATSLFIYRKMTVDASNSAASLWIAEVGIYSYSLYLIHEPFLGFSANLFKKLWNFVFLTNASAPEMIVYMVSMGSLVVLIPISRMLYYYLEKPSINLGNRILSKQGPKE